MFLAPVSRSKPLDIFSGYYIEYSILVKYLEICCKYTLGRECHMALENRNLRSSALILDFRRPRELDVVSPQRAELRCYYIFVGDRFCQQPYVLREPIHVGDCFNADGRIVIREIAPDQLSDQVRFRGREASLADFGGELGVVFERLVSFHHGADSGAGAFRRLCDSFVCGYQS
jgi:hypothetical protein